MGVLDGQPVDQAITNPAFINKNVDDVMPNMLGFDRPLSGTSIDDIQATINILWETTGATESVAGTVYDATPGTIANGDSHQTALSILADKFAAATGHAHSGSAGDGGPIAAVSITSVPLLGYLVAGPGTIPGTGSSNDISTLFSGSTPSLNSSTAGIVAITGYNRAALFVGATGTTYLNQILDTSGNLVYGRVTYSAGVWTMSYFSLLLGVETAYTFPSPTTLSFYYQALYNPLQPNPVYDPTLFLIPGASSGSSGGGGGGQMQWNAPSDGSAAPGFATEFNLAVAYFNPAFDGQQLYSSSTVPDNYVTGKPCKIRGSIYSPSTSGTILMKIRTTLIRAGTDPVSSTTNQRSTTNTALTNTVANQDRQVTWDVTDSTGHVNSVAISPGDTLIHELFRDTDTDSDAVRFILSSSYPSFT